MSTPETDANLLLLDSIREEDAVVPAAVSRSLELRLGLALAALARRESDIADATKRLDRINEKLEKLELARR